MISWNFEDSEFAVVDIETTGLFPGGHDRIVEVAMVRMDARGKTISEFTSLVNPQRDVGPTHIHGLRGCDVEGAPAFADIAGDVLDRLAGAVIVGHNVPFDLRFLVAEYQRLGVVFPVDASLCTLQLGYKLGIAPPKRNLSEVCAHFGIPLTDAHAGLGDARATAQLLTFYLSEASKRSATLADLGCAAPPRPKAAWPVLPCTGKTLTRAETVGRPSTAASYLTRLIQQLPAASSQHAIDDAPYFELLDRALEDRRLTVEEADGLYKIAAEVGMARDAVLAAHQRYLSAVADVAAADQKITETERRDLEYVAAVLGFTTTDVDGALAGALKRAAGRQQPAEPPPGPETLAGKSVCFTGALRCRIRGVPVTRDDAERLATEAGLRVLKSVSKKLDILVVADPDSLSSKAAKARELGTRIMAEAVFFRSIGVEVE